MTRASVALVGIGAGGLFGVVRMSIRVFFVVGELHAGAG